MKEDLKKANDTIKNYENGLNDHVNNTIKKIKNYFWGKIKTSPNRLCDWFKL